MLETPLQLQQTQAEWSRLLLGTFADAGVRDVVVSPGSRSTPLVIAAVAEERLRCRNFYDERTAAFFALGQARASGRPSLLICTSGTAAANYFPAVVEAGMAYVPLLVLSADRPLELVACGSNQTIDQSKLFGDHARRFIDLGHPEDNLRLLRGLRRIVAQAVFTATHPQPGAVHLNARLRKPLEPPESEMQVGSGHQDEVDRLLEGSLVTPSAPVSEMDSAALGELAEACRSSERGVIVCGPASMEQAEAREAVGALAARTGFAVFADAASQLRFRGAPSSEEFFIDGYDLLLRGPSRKNFTPDLVIQFGRSLTSKSWETLLAENPQMPLWTIAEHGWNDVLNTATRVVVADVRRAAEQLLEALDPKADQTLQWIENLRTADGRAASIADETLTSQSRLSEAAATREVVDALPAGAVLGLGNSLPIRHAQTWGRRPDVDLRVFSQRGASGIDGLLSGFAGAMSVHDGPGAMLIGDVSFLHDVSGLAAIREVEQPAAIVVLQNQGGRIFEMLPLARHSVGRDEAFEHWTTPHDVDLRHAAALHHLPFHRVNTRAGLRKALGKALRREGATILEATVPPSGAIEMNRELNRRLAG